MTKRTRLDSGSAREKLKPRGAPYWAEAGAKVDIGYRRLKAGVGSWATRRYLEETRTYVATTFAHADDLEEADGVNILSYHQAQAKARELAQAPSRRRGSRTSGRRSTSAGRLKNTSRAESSAGRATAGPARSETPGPG